MPSASPDVMAPEAELTRTAQPAFPALSEAGDFVSRERKRVLAWSAVVLIPCFWHRHIQATDLGSHVYNAWLAQLIHQGAAPGLHIVPQSSNVLFDLMLSGLYSLLGPIAAERIAVSIAVLIFFWGGFALCSAAAGRAAWSVVPVLAVTCYGFIFNMGFLNLYISTGLSLLGMAILWRGKRWDFLLLLPLVALIWMAHLLGTGGLLGLGAVLLVMRYAPVRWQLASSAAVLALYFAARFYVVKHFWVIARETDLYWLLGTDQFVVYSRAYAWVALAILTIAVIVLVLRLRPSGWKTLLAASAWMQLYAIMAIADYFAPGGIYHPKLQFMGYLPDRASLYTAVLLCALLAALRLAKWQTAALGIAALAFFVLLYRDTGRLDRIETKVEAAVSSLKPGDRVVATLFSWPESRVHDQHIVDRACVGHCYYIANYEASSGQFRIKGDPGNRIVTMNLGAVGAMQKGLYRVQPEDLPVSEVYACGATLDDICVREIKAGEYSGQAAYDELAAFKEAERRKVNP